MLYKLEQPDNSKIDSSRIADILINQSDINSQIQKVNEPDYLYWDKIKYKSLPKYITSPEEYWTLVKLTRKAQAQKSIIKAQSGEHFSWIKLPQFEKLLHEFDLYLGGNLILEKELDTKEKFRLISRGIMEESIASSQLEGANTTRKVAKQLIREKRQPRDKSEQMILNNYTAMKRIEDEYKNKALSIDMLFELHYILTNNVGDIPNERIGTFRKDKDDTIIGDEKFIYHEPPKMEFVKNEISKLISYANNELDQSYFIHPVIKSIFLHFWLGYLHPFFDGNGRIARAIFYWYLLKEGYWAVSFIPISKIIKDSPEQYKFAYIYTEQDNLDLTYFVNYNLKKIKQSIDEFKNYVEVKAEQDKKIYQLTKPQFNLNKRQIELIKFYQKDIDARITPKMYINFNQISKPTAIKDLKDLEKIKLVESKKEGKNVYYSPTDKLKSLLSKQTL